ncbi:cytochrome PufQ [Pseudaestuariivita sp.]|uniref:cytochrome PufQ n=1 Tax=Pseudaestuariivita sp. TaxID=2211669 RepID=UPI0040598BED
MTDITSQPPSAKPKASKAEFRVYFAIIFAAALPFALIAWITHPLHRKGEPNKGPIARAWSQARTVTPMIFSA